MTDPRAIRVLHVIHELGDGGADRALTRLANASDPRSVCHTIFSLRRGRGYGRMRSDVDVIYGGPDENAQRQTFRSLLKRRQFELVHGWTPHSSILAAQAAGALGIPLVQRQPTNLQEELHYEAEYTATYWRELRLAYSAADAVVVPSAALVECTRRLCDVRAPVVIENSIDVEATPMWCPRPRPGRPFTFAFVGRLCRQKDPSTMIEALAYLPRSLDWRLRIYGDGYLREAVADRSMALGVAACVSFEGFTPNWVSSGIDAFVFPTRYEGMSNALLEAAAAGLPIVASAIPENQAVLQDGAHALLVPPGDPFALAIAMANLATDVYLGEALGVAAREHVRKFSFDAMVRAHESLYRRLAATPEAHLAA